MRDVAFSCDDNGVPFLKASVWSLLAHYGGTEPLRVNVFEGWGGHSAAHKQELQAIVDSFNEAKVRGEESNHHPSSFALRPSSSSLRPSSFALRPSSSSLRPSSSSLRPSPFALRPSPFFSLRYVDIEPFVDPYADLILNREKSRWNVFTWTPIFTPAALPDATGNVIHFDIDMLFNADVSPLFELDLNVEKGQRSKVKGQTEEAQFHCLTSGLGPQALDPYLIACCYEYDRYGDNAGKVVWEKGVLPPTVERYFNTGVLVFNAEACRAERTWEKIVAWYREHYDIADRIEQDAWNALYHDRMLPLSVKWNFHDRAIKNYARWDLAEKYWLGNPPRECLEAALAPAILHFWGPKKPWKTSHRPYRKLYHAAMRAVGQRAPREPLLAPFHDLVNALNLRKIRTRLRTFQPPQSSQPSHD